MIGAIVGDVIGSVYEFDNVKVKDFPLFSAGSTFTDDSLMTIAVAVALQICNSDYTALSDVTKITMRGIAANYPHPKGGYGGSFGRWLLANESLPYNSFGNGAAMRVSPVAYYANNLAECKELSRKVTEISHNHPEGIKGAECTAVLTWLALRGSTMEELRAQAEKYYPEIKDLTVEGIRKDYYFDETCQGTVPQAIVCFLESEDFEDAIRNAMWIGGDSDTIGAITGAIAGAFYGIPKKIAKATEKKLDSYLLGLLSATEN